MAVPMKANPWGLRRFEMFPGIDSIRREMDTLFGSLARPFPTFRSTEREGWMPTLDVYEKDEEMVIRLDLPGIEKKDVKVKVLDDILMIEGERKLEKKIEEENYLCQEAFYGTFTRRIALPNPVEEYEVKATFQDGVLEIHVPVKVETEKPKEIPVR
ncbi:MAG TPA: Hsp20/alpha crystallin family protein [Gemmatimonadota bacterium]|nr:Hsp20/alpha crystallin family protein [Gemmatimonadota bacterium]